MKLTFKQKRKLDGKCVCGELLYLNHSKCHKHYNIESLRFLENKQKHKRMALAHYGQKCATCHETHHILLTIDHIDESGAKHRKILTGTGTGDSLYRYLKRNHYPFGYQTLCMNCNSGKHFNGGICPHKES